MTQKFFIFDFDGTIADTHHYLIGISNKLAGHYQYNTIHPTEIDTVKNMSSQEVIKHLKIPLRKIPAIMTHAKKEFYLGINQLKPIPGIKEALIKLKEAANSMGILSSNTEENVRSFLIKNKLNIFDFIENTSRIWSKNISLKQIIQRNKLSLENTIYVGDEIRDIVAARRVGIKIAAVTWGYNAKEALLKHTPDYMVQTPADILSIA